MKTCISQKKHTTVKLTEVEREMAELLQSNADRASSLASEVQQSLASYLGFKLLNISGPAPVLGSNIHDNLSSPLSNALSAWNNLIVSDANALLNIASTLEGTDSTVARGLLGVGGARL